MDEFIQARHYKRVGFRQIDYVVIHDMEAPEKNTTAENVAKWFAGDDAPKASAHWCHDPDSSVRCVRDEDVAFAAPGANHNGIQHELAGYARQTREEWLDGPSLAILKRAADKVKSDCMRFHVPMTYVDADGLRRGVRGVTTHLQVSRAFRRSTHWDPGYHFPIEVFLGMVRGAQVVAPGSTPGPIAREAVVLRNGDNGDAVTEWQKILVGAGYKITVDGAFGTKTEAATKKFQDKLGVKADGIVGYRTQEAVAKLLAWVASQRRTTEPAIPTLVSVAKLNSTGDHVRTIQQRLKDRGWKIVVDGQFGHNTKKVVEAFQKEKGLAVDGVVGPQTWDALWLSPVT